MIFLLSLLIVITPSIAQYSTYQKRPIFVLTNTLSCPFDQEPQYTPKYTTTTNGVISYDVTGIDVHQIPGRGAVALSGDGDTLAIVDPVENVVRAYNKVLRISESSLQHGKKYSGSWDQAGEDLLFTNQEGNLSDSTSIALSDDGEVMVVGAFWHALLDGGLNTRETSRDFQLFERNDSTTLGWTKSNEDINAMFPGTSISSIAISGDGNVVAVSVEL